VALARAHGARVVEGYWDDDFAAARNRLLEHVSTEWVLSVDADEVLETEPGALRQRLAGERADLLLVPVVSTTWSAADDGEEHRPARVFRRERAVWTDPLHEMLVPRDGGQDLVLAHQAAPVRLLHSGYHSDRMADKDKHARNLDIARAQVDALDDSSSDVVAARAWANYGRALVSAGRREEGLDALGHLLDLRGNRSEMLQGARSAVHVALATARLEDVDRWIDVATQHGEASGRLALWRAQLLLHHGDLDGAQAELDAARASTDVDLWGQPFDADDVVPVRAAVLSRQGRHAAALEVLVDLLGRRQESVPLPSLLQAAVNAGQPLGDLAAIGGPQFLARSLRDAMHLPPEAADQWLDAVYRSNPEPSVLVAGAVVAARLPMDAVLKWSLRAREAGAPDLCPLRSIGYDVERPAAERCLALAVLGDVLGETDALAHFDDLAADIPDDETGPLIAALAVYAPGLAVEATDQAAAV
jgi:tetratricopeptide (TPR) repeat protein